MKSIEDRIAEARIRRDRLNSAYEHIENGFEIELTEIEDIRLVLEDILKRLYKLEYPEFSE